MAELRLRKTVSAPGLLREVGAGFDEAHAPVPSRRFSLTECLMSGLAMFGLKYPSLLQFDRDARTDETVRANLRTLNGIERAPCGTDQNLVNHLYTCERGRPEARGARGRVVR